MKLCENGKSSGFEMGFQSHLPYSHDHYLNNELQAVQSILTSNVERLPTLGSNVQYLIDELKGYDQSKRLLQLVSNIRQS